MPNKFIDLQYAPEEGLEAALHRVCAGVRAAVREGVLVLLISDRYLIEGKLPIPCIAGHRRHPQSPRALGLRCNCNLLIETGTARDPHHFACLIGYGATAVYPYMAYQSLYDMMRKGKVKLDSGERTSSDAAIARPSARG